MKRFVIKANGFLNQNIQAFYHSEYHGGGNWSVDGTIENIITTLKNDITPYDNITLKRAVKRLTDILLTDIRGIAEIIKTKPLTICVVPRAKVKYNDNQLLFKITISKLINPNSPNFKDGTDYIVRKINTRITHRNRSGHGGDGNMPYVGITRDTCDISTDVRGKDILLIDDLYTKTINIDEDAIQALLDSGANSVYFYSLGKTVRDGF